MKNYTFILMPLLAVALLSCKTDYANLPTYTPTKQLQAVIEVPAGKSLKLHYDIKTKTFVADREAGKDRIIKFLPYPANFGFIPSTEIDKNGKGLEILVLSESMETGTVMEVMPLAVIQLDIKGELQHIIVAVPARPSERIISATDFYSFTTEYPAVKDILEKWFTNYSPTSGTKFIGWKNERFAEQEIQRWMRL